MKAKAPLLALAFMYGLRRIELRSKKRKLTRTRRRKRKEKKSNRQNTAVYTYVHKYL